MNTENKTKSHHLAAFLGGLVAGIAITALLISFSLPKMMIEVHSSNKSFDATVTAIETQYQASNWKVPKIYDLQKSLLDAGQEDVGRVKVISVCAPEHAYNLLKHDRYKKISAMMPCRLGVYEDEDGKVFITSMNSALLSKMFGGVIEKTMTKVSKDQKEILKKILE